MESVLYFTTALESPAIAKVKKKKMFNFKKFQKCNKLTTRKSSTKVNANIGKYLFSLNIAKTMSILRRHFLDFKCLPARPWPSSCLLNNTLQFTNRDQILLSSRYILSVFPPKPFLLI